MRNRSRYLSQFRSQNTKLSRKHRHRFEALEVRQLLAVAVDDTGIATENGGPVMFDVLANDVEDMPERVIYQDDFSGAGALNGQAPDVSGGSEAWLSSGLWNADGTKTANGTASSWLPFSPAPGHVYTLSIDANPDVSASSDWLAAGFAAGNNVNNWHPGNNTVGWLLNREDDTSASTIQTFLGPVTAGGASHDLNPDVVGAISLEIVLDTRPANWTIEWFANGNSLRAPAAFGTNPTINYVGFGAWSTATGSVDNFSLTVANPAPGTNLQVVSAESASGAPVTFPSGTGQQISYDPGNVVTASDTIVYGITDTSGITQPVTTARGSAGAFTVSASDLLEGITPTVTGSALTGREGTSNDPAVLSNGAFGPAASNTPETVPIQNNTVLTYDLDLTSNPQGYDLTGINTYSGWADAGRDNQNYTVLYATVNDPDAFIPLSTVGYAPNPAPSGLVNISAGGGILATRVGQIQFIFGAQENNEVGYRELDAFGAPSITAEVDVTITNLPNAAPAATDDTANAVEQGAPVSIDVTANDADSDGDDLAIIAADATSAAGATVTVSPSGDSLTYHPSSTAAFDNLAVGETATDTFTYTVTDLQRHLTGVSGSVPAGATSVLLTDLDNADLGDNRRVVVEFDVSRPENSTGDSWFTLELLGTGTGVFGADASSLVRTRTDSGTVHQLFTNGANVANSAPTSIATPLQRHVEATIDFSAAGIATGEQALITFRIDDDSDGTYDHTLGSAFAMTENTLDFAVQTTGKLHDFANFNVTSHRGGLVSNLFNTGVDATGTPLPGDVDDPHYSLTSQPFAGLVDATIPADGFPIGAWLGNDANSAWIGPDNADAANDGNGPPGEYIYRTTFSIPSDADLDTVYLSGRWATDNSGNDILINGVSTGATAGGFNAYSQFTITSGFQHGLNTLEFVMENGAPTGPTGLRVDDMLAGFEKVTTDTATVTVTVTGSNDGPPVAVNDSVTSSVTEDAAVDLTTEILSNDTDPDIDGNAPDDTLTVISVDDTGTTGTVTLAAGVVTYDPNGMYEQLGVGESATDSFRYVVADRVPLQVGVPIADLFNTGVDGSGTPLAGNLDDPHYEIISQPFGGTLGDATVPADGFPIPPWLANDANSAWTGPAANDGTGPPGVYVYRTTFTIPLDADLDSATLSGNWATDNTGRDILINGISTGNTTAGFNAYSPFTISSGFAFGVNTLDFLVVNGAPIGPTALRVDDMTGSYDIGYSSNSAMVTVTVNGVNDMPTVAVNTASVTVNEGDTATNSGSFADVDINDTVTISASVGTITQDPGSAGNWSWSLATDDGPSESGMVTITADDGQGGIDTVTFDLTVNNVAPIASIIGQTEAALAVPVPFTFAATDDSTADSAADFTFMVNWGDGSPIETIVGASPVAASHSFQSFGEVTVSVTATDKDGATSAAVEHTITIVPVAIVGDDLVATGTDGSDTIIVYSTSLGVRVRYNNTYYPLDGGTYSFNGQMIVNGRGGSDRIIAANGFLIDCNFDGGEGNDYLASGLGNDTLSGGDGNDVLLAGEGDNFLQGGDGSDRLEGRGGNDIMFGDAGNDRLTGNAGDDILDGGSDNDFLHGGLGDDLLFGDLGVDTLDGYFGNDVIFGGGDSDQLFGRGDHDLLVGGLGGDRLRGNDGDDTLIGGTSALEAQLEADLDLLQATAGASGLSPAVQAAVDAWFASPSAASRSLFEPLTDDNTADDLTGDSGADTFTTGTNDRFRDYRDTEDTTI